MTVRAHNVSSGGTVEIVRGDADGDWRVRPLGAGPHGETELVLASGWLDIQVNGFAGVDFNSGSTTPAEFEQARLALRGVGATRFLPTVITASSDHLARCLALIDEACRGSAALERAVPGVHLEGPFISPEDGARG